MVRYVRFLQYSVGDGVVWLRFCGLCLRGSMRQFFCTISYLNVPFYQSPEEYPPGGTRLLLITCRLPAALLTVAGHMKSVAPGLYPSPVTGLPSTKLIFINLKLNSAATRLTSIL